MSRDDIAAAVLVALIIAAMAATYLFHPAYA